MGFTTGGRAAFDVETAVTGPSSKCHAALGEQLRGLCERHEVDT